MTLKEAGPTSQACRTVAQTAPMRDKTEIEVETGTGTMAKNMTEGKTERRPKRRRRPKVPLVISSSHRDRPRLQ